MFWDPPDDLKTLLPSEDEREDFQAYYKRISVLLPNFPEECLKQTMFQHGIHSLRLWGWLDPYSLSFREVLWSTEDVASQISSFNEPAVEDWKSQLSESRELSKNKLGSYMITSGTWPVPPIVLDNVGAIAAPDGTSLTRYHLLEGYHRLAYLRALHENEHWTPKAEHRLWLASVSLGLPT